MPFFAFSLDTSDYVAGGSRLRRSEGPAFGADRASGDLYSAFKTWIGSTLAARRAGSRVAKAATAVSTRAITT